MTNVVTGLEKVVFADVNIHSIKTYVAMATRVPEQYATFPTAQ